MEQLGLPTVRAAGLALRPGADDAVLITEYLSGCWQYRRLLMRIPVTEVRHRQRLFDAVAWLVVDLHRRGVFWGDCSLANILFKRDGQVLQAYLVDAETAQVEESLTDGQRQADLDIMLENIAGGLMDLALRLEQPDEVVDQLLEEAHGVTVRYRELWDALHTRPTFPYSKRHETVSQIRRLNDLGFAVEEVRLVQVRPGEEEVRLDAVVADRRFHASELHRLTGLEVGEGQARLLLNDLKSHGVRLRAAGVPESQVARLWRAAGPRAGAGRAGAAAAGRAGPGAGLLRPARGALAAERAGRSRRRRRARARGAEGRSGARRLGGRDGGRRAVPRRGRGDRRRPAQRSPEPASAQVATRR